MYGNHFVINICGFVELIYDFPAKIIPNVAFKTKRNSLKFVKTRNKRWYSSI